MYIYIHYCDSLRNNITFMMITLWPVQLLVPDSSVGTAPYYRFLIRDSGGLPSLVCHLISPIPLHLVPWHPLGQTGLGMLNIGGDHKWDGQTSSNVTLNGSGGKPCRDINNKICYLCLRWYWAPDYIDSEARVGILICVVSCTYLKQKSACKS